VIVIRVAEPLGQDSRRRVNCPGITWHRCKTVEDAREDSLTALGKPKKPSGFSPCGVITLITYDQKTIPDLLIELYAEGGHHAGIIFVDDVTIPSADFGMLTRALISFWERYHSLDWQDRVHFLDRPPRA